MYILAKKMRFYMKLVFALELDKWRVHHSALPTGAALRCLAERPTCHMVFGNRTSKMF